MPRRCTETTPLTRNWRKFSYAVWPEMGYIPGEMRFRRTTENQVAKPGNCAARGLRGPGCRRCWPMRASAIGLALGLAGIWPMSAKEQTAQPASDADSCRSIMDTNFGIGSWIWTGKRLTSNCAGFGEGSRFRSIQPWPRRVCGSRRMILTGCFSMARNWAAGVTGEALRNTIYAVSQTGRPTWRSKRLMITRRPES